MLSTIRFKLKKIILTLLGRINHLRKTVNCNHLWYGSLYGGFYLCPDLLNEDSIVYSFGIGEDISFDKALIEKHNCCVFGFDPTPKSMSWVNNQSLPQRFYFNAYGIANKSGFTDFYLPKNPEHVSGSIMIQNNINTDDKITVEMKSIQDIINELGHSKIDVLKMDIEGAEYDIIENLLDAKIQIDQIIIEFHDRLFKDGRSKTINAISILERQGYKIFAVSDTMEEVSFINEKMLKYS